MQFLTYFHFYSPQQENYNLQKYYIVLEYLKQQKRAISIETALYFVGNAHRKLNKVN